MSVSHIYPLSKPEKGAGGKTGSWRTFKPVIDHEKCIGCLRCWIFCPEGCISKKDLSIDYDYCKGCGICEAECVKKAITMVKEEGR